MISWKERFPLRHVRQHGQESFIDRSTPGEVWVPDAVLEQRAVDTEDVEYEVQDVNGVDMRTRKAWRSAERVPAELVQRWLDQQWFDSLRKKAPVVRDPTKLVQKPQPSRPPVKSVPQPRDARVRDRHTLGITNANSQALGAPHGSKTSTPAPPTPQIASAGRRSNRTHKRTSRGS